MSKALPRVSTAATWLAAFAISQMVVAPVYAAKPKKVLVIQTQGDDLADADKAAITTVIRDGLKSYSNLEVLPTPEVDLLDVMMDLECLDIDNKCIAAIGKKYSGRVVIFTDAAPDGGGFSLTVKRIDVRTGKAVKSGTGKALVRSDLAKTVASILVKVVGPKPVKKAPKKKTRVNVEISTIKPGATVYLGRLKLKGVTPMTVSLKPGRYTIRVKQKGFKTVKDKLKVRSVGENKVVYDLVSLTPTKPVDEPEVVAETAPAPTAEDDTPVYEQWWFWTVIGVAVVGGVTAGLVVGLQDDEPAASGVLNFGLTAPDADPRVRAAR